MRPRIFEKGELLRPSAMATVAERRFDDAEALAKTGENARANGVAYLSGFVVEILLKAQLVKRFPAIAAKRQHDVLDSERLIWRLIWTQHDLKGMLDQLPAVTLRLEQRGLRDGVYYAEDLRKVCAHWTIQARYSPHTIQMTEARRFLERVRVLKELLK
jgi:hypothetical protein